MRGEPLLLAALSLLLAAPLLGVTAGAAYLVNPLSLPLPVTVDGAPFVVAGEPLPVAGGSRVCADEKGV